MQHENDNLFPFCCDTDSAVFATLFEIYVEQRAKKAGFKIIQSSNNNFATILPTKLYYLMQDCAPTIVCYRNDLVVEAEAKYYYLTVLLLIYYVQLIYQAVPQRFEEQVFLNFIKSESLETMQPLATSLSDKFLQVIRYLFEDINFLKDLIQ